MIKAIPIFLACLAFSAVGQDVAADAATLRKELFGAYGFCTGQQLSIDRIKNEFPAVAAKAVKAELEFEGAFGGSCRVVGEFLGAQARNEVQSTLKQYSANTVLTEPIAIEFARKVSSRAKGEIDPPYKETLLAFHPTFEISPSSEFARGFKRKFSTKGHLKAKGLNIEISVPVSWKAREGNRPNIIQFFKSKNGWGEASFVLQIRDIPLPKGANITQRDIDLMFSPKGLKELVSDADTLLESKPITLEGEKGGMWVYEESVSRLESSVTLRTLQYGIIYKNRFIVLQFACGGSEAKRSEWVAEFAKHRTLFQQVANSLVIVDRY